MTLSGFAKRISESARAWKVVPPAGAVGIDHRILRLLGQGLGSSLAQGQSANPKRELTPLRGGTVATNKKDRPKAVSLWLYSGW